jgi:hypothetical protein
MVRYAETLREKRVFEIGLYLKYRVFEREFELGYRIQRWEVILGTTWFIFRII